jgi:hypothetical protein
MILSSCSWVTVFVLPKATVPQQEDKFNQISSKPFLDKSDSEGQKATGGVGFLTFQFETVDLANY